MWSISNTNLLCLWKTGKVTLPAFYSNDLFHMIASAQDVSVFWSMFIIDHVDWSPLENNELIIILSTPGLAGLLCVPFESFGVFFTYHEAIQAIHSYLAVIQLSVISISYLRLLRFNELQNLSQ